MGGGRAAGHPTTELYHARPPRRFHPCRVTQNRREVETSQGVALSLLAPTVTLLCSVPGTKALAASLLLSWDELQAVYCSNCGFAAAAALRGLFCGAVGCTGRKDHWCEFARGSSGTGHENVVSSRPGLTASCRAVWTAPGSIVLTGLGRHIWYDIDGQQDRQLLPTICCEIRQNTGLAQWPNTTASVQHRSGERERGGGVSMTHSGTADALVRRPDGSAVAESHAAGVKDSAEFKKSRSCDAGSEMVHM